MERFFKPLQAHAAALWRWVREFPNLTAWSAIAAVLVILALQSNGYHEQFETGPRSGLDMVDLKGWVPPSTPILCLTYLLPYLTVWLLAGGVVFHIAILRAIPDSQRAVLPCWIAGIFLCLWGVASDLSEHLEHLEISITGEPASLSSYIVKLVMIAVVCLTPPLALHLYSRASILNRYTLRTFLAPAAFCFIAFSSLWILMDLLDSLKDFQDARIPVFKMALFYMSLMPFIYVSVAPAAVLLGVLYALTKMSRSNEIVSMLGAGRSVFQILTPVFVAALLASMVGVAANYYWAPRAEGNRQAIMRALTEGEAGTILAQSLMFHNPQTRRTWYAGSFPFNLRDEKIRNVEVRQADENGVPERTWIARSAFWWPDTGQWRFYNGQEIIYKDGKPQTMIDFTGRVLGSPSKLDVNGIEETPWSIVSSALVPDFMGVPDLISYLKAHKTADPRRLAPFRTHLYHRTAFPWQPLVLALVAAPLGIAYSRRGSLGGIAGSIFIFFGMIFINDLFLSLGKGSHLHPGLTVWLPNLIFASIGLTLLYLRSQNKELPKFSLKTAQVRRPKGRVIAPANAI